MTPNPSLLTMGLSGVGLDVAASGGWTSRARLLTALGCGVADRVPISTYELAGYNSLAWENSEPSYRRLMERIRADVDCIAMWNAASNATWRHTAADLPVEKNALRQGSRQRVETVLRTPTGPLREILEQDDHVHTAWLIEYWCKNAEDVDRALAVPFTPLTWDYADLPRLRAEVGDRGIIMSSLADPAYQAASLMGFEDFTLWVYERPEHFGHAVEVMAEQVYENLARALSGGVVDLYRIYGPEYFTPPFLPPAMFQRFVVPHVTTMTRMIHDAGGKVRLHCHGRIAQVLDMILSTGVDGIDPCEPPPDGDLELDQVKQRCAAAGVSVFGNMELKLLEYGTAQAVEFEVHRIMDQAKRGGGFVLMPTAAPIDVPLSSRTEANYFAFIDAGLQYGRY